MGKNWHSLPLGEIFKGLKANLNGLTQKEAEKRLKKYGLNKLPEEKPPSKLRLFLEQLKSPLVYILLIAGLVTLFLGDYSDAVVIFGAVLLNTFVGYFQEKKAGQALRTLKKVLQAKTIVIRNGREIEVSQKNIVPGDIIFLRAGDKVSADARIIEAHNLKVSESALTGEWLAANKKIGQLSEGTPLADRDNMVYMGTNVESGWGRAVVVNTALETEIGQVAQMIHEAVEKKTPYQRRLSRF